METYPSSLRPRCAPIGVLFLRYRVLRNVQKQILSRLSVGPRARVGSTCVLQCQGVTQRAAQAGVVVGRVVWRARHVVETAGIRVGGS